MEPRTKTSGPIPGGLIVTHTHLSSGKRVPTFAYLKSRSSTNRRARSKTSTWSYARRKVKASKLTLTGQTLEEPQNIPKQFRTTATTSTKTNCQIPKGLQNSLAEAPTNSEPQTQANSYDCFLFACLVGLFACLVVSLIVCLCVVCLSV